MFQYEYAAARDVDEWWSSHSLIRSSRSSCIMFFTCTSTEAKCIALSQNTSLDMQMFGISINLSESGMYGSIPFGSRLNDLRTMMYDCSGSCVAR